MFFVIAGVDQKDSALEGVLEGTNDFAINWSWASYAESMTLRDGMDDFPYIGKTPCISSVGGTGWTKDRSKAARGQME